MPRKAKPTEDIQEAKDPALYELGYLLIPSIAQAELDNEVATLRSVLEEYGATIEKGDGPEMRDLAYSMTLRRENVRKDYDSGYFGWFDFTVTPDKIDALQEKLKGNQSLIRYIVIKKDPEDIASSSFRKPKAEDEVDQVIEKLVEENA